jgi:WD40 repeat protein
MVAAATIRHLTIWRIENGASRQVLDYDFGESIGIPSGIAFARDGSMLAANFNGGMAVIDMATLQIHLNPPSAGTGGPLVADPLGRPLFLAVIGASAALVDTDLTVNTPMPATGTAVISAAFSPDGSLAVTGGTDGSIAVLDVESSMQYGSFIRAPFGKVQSLTFLPHSKTLVTAHPDINGTSTIGFWNLDPDFLVQKACEVAGRDLTDAEWETYIPGYDHKPVCSA